MSSSSSSNATLPDNGIRCRNVVKISFQKPPSISSISSTSSNFFENTENNNSNINSSAASTPGSLPLKKQRPNIHPSLSTDSLSSICENIEKKSVSDVQLPEEKESEERKENLKIGNGFLSTSSSLADLSQAGSGNYVRPSKLKQLKSIQKLVLQYQQQYYQHHIHHRRQEGKVPLLSTTVERSISPMPFTSPPSVPASSMFSPSVSTSRKSSASSTIPYLFLIDAVWFQKWLKYVLSPSTTPSNGREGENGPGPVTNWRLVDTESLPSLKGAKASTSVPGSGSGSLSIINPSGSGSSSSTNMPSFIPLSFWIENSVRSPPSSSVVAASSVSFSSAEYLSASYPLEPKLQCDVDYYLLPSEAWNALFSWYNGGPPLPRFFFNSSRLYYSGYYPLSQPLMELLFVLSENHPLLGWTGPSGSSAVAVKGWILEKQKKEEILVLSKEKILSFYDNSSYSAASSAGSGVSSSLFSPDSMASSSSDDNYDDPRMLLSPADRRSSSPSLSSCAASSSTNNLSPGKRIEGMVDNDNRLFLADLYPSNLADLPCVNDILDYHNMIADLEGEEGIVGSGSGRSGVSGSGLGGGRSLQVKEGPLCKSLAKDAPLSPTREKLRAHTVEQEQKKKVKQQAFKHFPETIPEETIASAPTVTQNNGNESKMDIVTTPSSAHESTTQIDISVPPPPTSTSVSQVTSEEKEKRSPSSALNNSSEPAGNNLPKPPSSFERSSSASSTVSASSKVMSTSLHCVVCGDISKMRCSVCCFINYCNKECQRIHWKYHKNICKSLKEHLSSHKIDELPTLPPNSQISVFGRQGRCGFYNLGNSCYMNSSLQCLTHIKPLTSYFLSSRYLHELNASNRDGSRGKKMTFFDVCHLILSLVSFLSSCFCRLNGYCFLTLSFLFFLLFFSLFLSFSFFFSFFPCFLVSRRISKSICKFFTRNVS
jgi:hypothetical protein